MGVAEAHVVAALEPGRVFYSKTVDEGSIGRLEIGNSITADPAPDDRVVARDRGSIEHDVVVFGVTNGGFAGPQRILARRRFPDRNESCREPTPRWISGRRLLTHS